MKFRFILDPSGLEFMIMHRSEFGNGFQKWHVIAHTGSSLRCVQDRLVENERYAATLYSKIPENDYYEPIEELVVSYRGMRFGTSPLNYYFYMSGKIDPRKWNWKRDGF
jgi:hypothetical protein